VGRAADCDDRCDAAVRSNACTSLCEVRDKSRRQSRTERAKVESHAATTVTVENDVDAEMLFSCTQQISPRRSADSLIFLPNVGRQVERVAEKPAYRPTSKIRPAMPRKRRERGLSEIALGRLKRSHVEILRLMLQGITTTDDLSRHTGYAQRTIVNKFQEIYGILSVRRKIDALSLCHTDPGLRVLLTPYQE
jgi:hypothetical protein